MGLFETRRKKKKSCDICPKQEHGEPRLMLKRVVTIIAGFTFQERKPSSIMPCIYVTATTIYESSEVTLLRVKNYSFPHISRTPA